MTADGQDKVFHNNPVLKKIYFLINSLDLKNIVFIFIKLA